MIEQKTTLDKRLAAVEARNRRVEDDKAWETSLTRRVLLMCLTFTAMGIYLSWLGVPRPWLNAIVPTLGYVLSTLVLKKAKQLWLRKRHTMEADLF